VRLVEIDLASPLPDLDVRRSPSAQIYRRAVVFVRLHTEPLALVEIDLDEGSLGSGALARAIWSKVSRSAGSHLVRDGIDAPAELNASGLGFAGTKIPRCEAERSNFLSGAPPLTVLIPSRERPDRLRRCLDSILSSDYPHDRIELLIVDNAPASDATQRVVDAYTDRTNIRYLREDSLGSASARNRGLREVETDLVLMTDDDTVVDKHWITEVARTFSTYPEAAVVSGLLVPMELDTPAQVWFEQFGGFSRGFERRVFDLNEHWPANEPLYPWTAGVFGTGNNFAFRIAAIRAVGGFDPALGNGTPALGGVDTEILLRTILSGNTIVYEPRAIVHHAHRIDYAALRRQIYAYGAGLTAVWLKTLLANPALSVDFARKIAPGLRFALSRDSSKNSKKQTDYPSELTWIELRGMLYGPIGYARSRHKYGPHAVPRATLPTRAGRPLRMPTG
jgi:GT2 family glycosyltransferase